MHVHERGYAAGVAMWVAGLLWLGTGCETGSATRRAMTPPYEPTNVYRFAPQLPATVRRVAILPLNWGAGDATLAEGGRMLEPVLEAELRKRQLFDLVRVGREQVGRWTGKEAWSSGDALPAELLARVREATGCEAILFSQLTVYRAYPPLAVGLNLRLVDAHESMTWWSIDEVFDAGMPSVGRAAEIFARTELNLPSNALDGASVLSSPRRFGQYAAHAAFSTLPPR